MKHKFLILFLSLASVFAACKEAGQGGDAAIRGYVHVQKWNSTFTQFISEFPAKDVYVYIIYGDRTFGYDDRVKTDFNGNFEFSYLYEGRYRVYTYSKDSTLNDPSGIVPVVREINITDRKQFVELDTMLTFQVK